MNKIEQLLQKYCPDGVEFFEIKDLVNEKFWIMPATPKFEIKGEISYITSKNLKGGNIDFTNIKKISQESYSVISKNRPIIKDDILIGMIGTIGEVARVKESDGDFYGQNMYLLRLNQEKINISYFLHFFDSKTMKMYFNGIKNASSQGYLKANQVDSIQIPVPPIKIQQEIVKILDTFTQLEAELEAELEARKKQYEYYRDEMLSFEEDEVEFKSFGDIALIQRGASPRPIQKYITDDINGVPWIKIGDTESGSKYVENTKQRITSEGAKKSRILNKGDFIISNSMSYGRPYILNITGAIHDGWASISNFQNELNSDFLYHYLSSKIVQNYWKSKINSSSVSNLNADIIKALKIPVPTLQKQQEIVDVLDKFDALVNDISSGLPAEIQARKQQYEYYREKLLTFKELKK